MILPVLYRSYCSRCYSNFCSLNYLLLSFLSTCLHVHLGTVCIYIIMQPPYLSIQFITQFQYLLLNIIMNEIFWGNLECNYNYTKGLYPSLGIGCMLMLIITEHPAHPYSATDVARCRDGDVSRVSLKYDATECSPGLLSTEWYPSLLLAAAECSLWLECMEWYPSLFLEFFHQLVFPCRHTYSSETRGTIPTSLLVFCGKHFYSPCNIYNHSKMVASYCF